MVDGRTLASVLLIAGAVVFANWQRQTPAPIATFVELRPSLYRLTYHWSLPIGAPAPVATWLVESSLNAWILIDAGTTEARNQQAILQGIQSVLSSAEDTLRLILVTHAHPDHTGALSKVLQAYPAIKVAFHENEAPYLVSGGRYADLNGDNFWFNTIKPFLAINTTLVPQSRALHLKGQSGDVADVFTYANWLPQGVLQWLAIPGHSPGQVAFFHKPSGSVIAADGFIQMSSWWPLSSTKDIRPMDPPKIVTSNVELMKASQKNLADLADAKTFFPSHDSATGISAQMVKEYVMT